MGDNGWKPKQRGGYEAAAWFAVRIFRDGQLNEDEAARILAHMLPGDWRNEEKRRKTVLKKRVHQIISFISGPDGIPISEEVGTEGYVWRWEGLP